MFWRTLGGLSVHFPSAEHALERICTLSDGCGGFPDGLSVRSAMTNQNNDYKSDHRGLAIKISPLNEIALVLSRPP